MQEFLTQLLSEYAVLAPFIFIIIRSTSVIFPPIPGIIYDLAGIAFFGPIFGFIYAEAGIMLGAMVSFYIARVYREPIVKRIVSLQKISKWEDTISEKKKFWMLVAIRIPTNIVFDYISYAAGLTKISPSKFFFSSLIGMTPTMFLIYYFGGLSLQKGFYYSIAFLLILFIGWLVFVKVSKK